jgi:DedD protein
VGAVALVLLAVIVLPMVFDPEPRRSLPPVSVRIPDESDSTPAPRAPAPEVPAPKAPEGPRAGDAPAVAAREYIVPVGAYQNADKVIAALASAKIPHYTEPAPGNLTRVRAGPFSSKEAADKAVERLKSLGLKPGPATSRRG